MLDDLTWWAAALQLARQDHQLPPGSHAQDSSPSYCRVGGLATILNR